MSDPFKEMARQYDAAVVAKGGRSIFGRVRFSQRPIGCPVVDGKSGPTRITASGPAWVSRPAHIPKPQRIMARTYGIIGAGNLSDFDEAP